jgi:hypothetical protein
MLLLGDAPPTRRSELASDACWAPPWSGSGRSPVSGALLPPGACIWALGDDRRPRFGKVGTWWAAAKTACLLVTRNRQIISETDR